MVLRIVYWLRHPRHDDAGAVAASPMDEVRRALRRLDDAGLDVWSPAADARSAGPLLVDRTGHIYVRVLDTIEDTAGQLLFGRARLDLLGVFEIGDRRRPDLVRPRPHLRIVPGKLSGEPHVAQTRIATASIAALHRRGYPLDLIAELYPDADQAAIVEAIDLEEQLTSNVTLAA